MPTTNATHILDHLLKTAKAITGQDKVVVAQKPLRRGYDFVFFFFLGGGYVHAVRVHSQAVNDDAAETSKVFIKGKCWASQKENTKYTQKMVFERSLCTFVPAVDDQEPDSLEADLPAAEDVGTGATGCLTPTAEEVTFAKCSSCVAGQHIFALLMAIEAYAGKGMVLLGGQSTTLLMQEWGPTTRNIEPKRVMLATIEKARPDEERKGKAITSTLYEVRGPKMQQVRHDATKRLKRARPSGSRLHGRHIA